MRSDRNRLLTEFFQMQQELERLLDDYLKSGQAALAPDRSVWRPPVDVYETVESFIVKVELAGLNPEEDVKILLQGNHLLIQGQRRDRSGTKKLHYHQAEVNYGPFQCEVILPEALDETTIPQASYQQGFLEITLPKSRALQPQRIVVAVEDADEQESEGEGDE